MAKKLQSYKGFVIAEFSNQELSEGHDLYGAFFKDEWALGNGNRYADMEFGTLASCKEWIDCYDED
jgi:hypothetical protein